MSALGVIATVLGAIGLLFILAGPAFQLLPGSNNLWIFTALACWIVGGAVGRIAKKVAKKEEK